MAELRAFIDQVRGEFGVPYPAIKGISTDILREHEQSGETIGEIAEEYRLSDEDVRWAIAYETSARAA